MKYSVDKKDNYCIFSLGEEKLDSILAPELKSELLSLQSGGVENLILDLDGVKYVDSSGLSVLLRANKFFSDTNGIFVIANASEFVMKLIKISQLEQILHIFGSLQESVEAVFLNEIEKDIEGEES